MSGQSAVAFEQSSPDLVDFSQEATELEQSDPIAAFLEKHGSSMVANHEGQMVTVAEAMANCPPFARLVEIMGEGALALTAAQRPEEKEEAEETEPEEETENKDDKIEQKAEANEPKKTADSTQQENSTPKPETPKVEILPAPSNSKQEAGANYFTSNNVEAISSISSGGIATSPPEIYKPVSSEKVIADTPNQEAQLFENPGVSEASSIISERGYSIKTKEPEPVIISAANASLLSRPPAKVSVQSLITEQVSMPSEAGSVSNLEPEELASQSENESEFDQLYLAPESEFETSTDVLRAEAGSIQDANDLEIQHLNDEQQQLPGEPVELETSGKQVDEDFIITVQEATVFYVSEYTQDKTEIVSELSIPVEEVEQTISLVVERIDELDGELTENTHQLLERIIEKVEVPQSILESDLEEPETILKTEEVEEELKELFIQLFDQLEIDYSPELINTFVVLALKGDLSEMIDTDEKEVVLIKGGGTHEIINKILLSINSIKQALKRAYLIGKSIMRLYTFEYPINNHAL